MKNVKSEMINDPVATTRGSDTLLVDLSVQLAPIDIAVAILSGFKCSMFAEVKA